MLSSLFRFMRPVALGLALVSCAAERAVAPAPPPHAVTPSADGSGPVSASGGVVISQVYGGGGNTGATYTNDYVELYNAGTTDVSLAGWSVQYASSTGTNWQVTSLSGTIASGHYYLVQESQGGGGTTPLPTPDATGNISMSGTKGKVALVNGTTSLTGGTGCPIASPIVDLVGFGAANCSEGSHPTPTLSNSTAAIRLNEGAQDTNDNAADFTEGAPNPRNGGAAAPSTGTPVAVTVTPPTASIVVDASQTFTASATDSAGGTVSSTYTWSSSDTTVATINDSGIATGVKVGTTTITATSANGKQGTATLTVKAVAPPASVTVSPASRSIVVGTTQKFTASAKDSSGATTPSTYTWSSSNTSVAVIDAYGNATALAAGTTTITATAANDVAGSTTLTVTNGTSAAVYRNNVEFGTPTDGNASDDFIIARPQYTLSYNSNRNDPNWVSWNLNATQLGAADRCNCFMSDPALPSDYYHVVTSDYTNGGFDRGHMTPSGDRTASPADNLVTFYTTNIVPQYHNLNAGPWEDLETYSRTLVTGQNKELYIISGGIFPASPQTLKNEGKIQIPSSTWKIVVVVGAGQGLSSVHSTSDLQVIAVNMPNTLDVPISDPWTSYTTTVDAIEKATGYNFLSALPDSIQKIVEANDHPPVTTLTAKSTTTVRVGQPISVAGQFTDPDGRGDAPWTMTFDWNDGTVTKSGLLANPSGAQYARNHTYTTTGTYTVRYTVRDKYGASSYSDITITVQP